MTTRIANQPDLFQKVNQARGRRMLRTKNFHEEKKIFKNITGQGFKIIEWWITNNYF